MTLFLKKYSWAIYLFFIFIGTCFLAKIFFGVVEAKIRGEQDFSPLKKNLVVSSLGPGQAEAYDNYRVIFDRNIFDSSERAPDLVLEEKKIEKFDPDAPPVETSLPIKVESTFSVGNGMDKRSSATISGKGKKEEIYTVGGDKSFHPGVKLTQILPDRIIFINGPRREFAMLEGFKASGSSSRSRPKTAVTGSAISAGGQAPGIKQLSEDSYIIDRSEVDKALGSLDKIITQIRARPHPDGLELQSVRRNSLFAKLGLRRGDVLESINGQKVTIQKGFQLLNGLKNANEISINLQRSGQRKTLDYRVQ